jgi:hypothetical protein
MGGSQQTCSRRICWRAFAREWERQIYRPPDYRSTSAKKHLFAPLTFPKRGGRKLVVTPDGASWAPRPRVDNAMVKALARAFRWRKMLDSGVHATIEDLARAKVLAPSYVSSILRLTLLAPEIVEAILDGRQRADLQLDDLLEGFLLEWELQRRAFARYAAPRSI